MENSIKRLAIIMNVKMEENLNCHYIMPINNIDGLPVEVIVILWKSKKGMTLRIVTEDSECAYEENAYNGTYQPYQLWSKEFNILENETPVELTTRLLRYSTTTIPKLRFNKYIGVLSVDQTNLGSPELFQELFACETVKLSFDKCSVCHDLTRCTTKCGHHLCHMCFSGIKRVHDEDIGDSVKKCPICRETILL